METQEPSHIVVVVSVVAAELYYQDLLYYTQFNECQRNSPSLLWQLPYGSTQGSSAWMWGGDRICAWCVLLAWCVSFRGHYHINSFVETVGRLESGKGSGEGKHKTRPWQLATQYLQPAKERHKIWLASNNRIIVESRA